MYSIASPVAAMMTFLILAMMHNKSGNSTNKIDWYSGIAMMVSVGTFLYVVTIHILPEVFLKNHVHGHEHFEDSNSSD